MKDICSRSEWAERDLSEVWPEDMREPGPYEGSYVFRTENSEYLIDALGYLCDPADWTEDFAGAMAGKLGIEEMYDEHWLVLKVIRASYHNRGVCPSMVHTCKLCRLSLCEFEALFPQGYSRGACLLAGIGY